MIEFKTSFRFRLFNAFSVTPICFASDLIFLAV
jgi:hypothetical protein